jgi:hypothetical protein
MFIASQAENAGSIPVIRSKVSQVRAHFLCRLASHGDAKTWGKTWLKRHSRGRTWGRIPCTNVAAGRYGPGQHRHEEGCHHRRHLRQAAEHAPSGRGGVPERRPVRPAVDAAVRVPRQLPHRRSGQHHPHPATDFSTLLTCVPSRRRHSEQQPTLPGQQQEGTASANALRTSRTPGLRPGVLWCVG